MPFDRLRERGRVPSVGTLDWQPVLDHLDLVAAPVAAALTGPLAAVASDCFVAPIDADLSDTAACCEAYQISMEASANCVVVAGRRGDLTTMAACLVRASDRADVNKTVRKHLDVRKISFASMDDATSATQMEYGGITPIGLPGDWPILVDEAVAATDWIFIGSGLRRSKLLIPGQLATTLPAAVVLGLAQN